jgi:hypothetical protein
MATSVAVTILGRIEFAVFATAYFLAQVPIYLPASLVFRWLRVGEQTKLKGPGGR